MIVYPQPLKGVWEMRHNIQDHENTFDNLLKPL